MQAIAKKIILFCDVPENIKTPNICKVAIKADYNNLYFISENKQTPELCNMAIGMSVTRWEHDYGEKYAYAKNYVRIKY